MYSFNTSIRESGSIDIIAHLSTNPLITSLNELSYHHSSRYWVWIENNVGNYLISSVGHFVSREELGDNSLTSLSRWYLVSLFKISSSSDFNSNINDILFILYNMDILYTPRFLILIQERSLVFWFILSLGLFLCN